jgi:hypothetical protein
MGRCLTTECQGYRLPQRRFASTRFRVSSTLLNGGAFFLLALAELLTPNLNAQLLAAPHATVNLTAAWQPLGPSSVVSANYSNVTGRVAAIATDPTGNIVYLGTTGGGVWKSINAAGPLSVVTFMPLTDTLPVFSGNTSSSSLPSLTIGALAVQPASNPVLVAGTGDPNNAADSYYGEGLLISPDNGLTWALVNSSNDNPAGSHSLIGLATAGIAFSTATPTLVVAAFSTSPQAAVVGAVTYNSFPGLYYSNDAGQTWHMATIQDGTTAVQNPQGLGTGEIGNAVTSVVWDAVRAMFYAAVRSHGYYSSPNGVLWTRLITQPGTNLTTANCPVGANGTGSPNCPIYRGMLAVQPVTGDLYALTVDANNLDQGLWQDLCSATSGSCAKAAPTFANRIDNGALEIGTGSTVIAQGSYNLVLNAAPAAGGSTNLYVGTVDLYRCAIAAGSSSCTLRNTTNALDGCNAPAKVAPAQHAIAAVAQASGIPLLFLGNDSGLWRSLDGVAETTDSVCAVSDATHFDNLNAAIGAGGSLSEVVGFAQDPGNANVLIAGLGANGSAASSTAATLGPWPQLSAGEGGYPAIDAVTPANWYVPIGAGVNLDACPLGSNCTAADFPSPATIGPTQVASDVSLLDTPTLLDPALTTSLLVGTCRVWRGPAGSGSQWSNANALSPAFGGTTLPCTPYSPLIRSIAAGGPPAISANLQNAGSTVIYAGIAGAQDGGGAIPGHLFVTRTANKALPTWTDISTSAVTNDISNAHVFNPQHYDVSSITVDPHDATGATVYATILGFGAPLPVPHLYRSIAFGGSWLNITANLPSVPANAVVVDPNNALTVYVATDAGVYVALDVTTCSTENCWSVLGTALPNAPILSLAVSATLPTGDGRSGVLRAGSYGRGLWQTPLLTATTAKQAAITLSTTSLTFTARQVGTHSAAQTITLSSSGSAPVVFGSLGLTGDFTETDNCAGQTIVVGSSCSVQIVFAATATGARSGQLTVYANIAGGQATVSLNGTGTTAAAIVLTPLALSFPATIVNQTAASQNITVSNTGGTLATLSSPVLSGNTGDFAVFANTCGPTLAAGTSCTFSITFTPTASGARSATLSVTDNAGTSSAATQTASLTGIGEAPATDTLSAFALSFAQQQIGTTSAAQTITLTNSGGVPLTLIAASVPPGDFSVVNVCGNSLAAHATCAFNVIFSPTAVGPRTATLTITDQFRYQTVTLSGTGIAGPGVSLTPALLVYPATGVGLTALAQTLTLTNNGGVPLIVSSVAVSPGFAIALNSCTTTVAVNASCSLTIVFAPTAPGPIAGTLTFTDNAGSGVQATSLSGTGIDFALTAAGVTSAAVAGSGASVTYALQLSSLSGLSGNVALGCTGAPVNSICTVTPGIGSLGTTTPVIVTLETAVPSTVALSRPPRSSRASNLAKAVLLAMLLPVAFMQRRRYPRFARLILLLSTLGVLSSCGASRAIPTTGTTGGGGTPTPPGTSTLTITASAAGLTRAVSLTLTVQ